MVGKTRPIMHVFKFEGRHTKVEENPQAREEAVAAAEENLRSREACLAQTQTERLDELERYVVLHLFVV